MIAILIPVLRRPHRVEPVLRSIRSSTPGALVLFICDPDDEEEIDAIEREGGEFTTVDGNYARKIRHGVEETTEPLIFTGADDLEFLRGWLESAEAELERGAQVVGVNDLIPRRRDHATHFLMTRGYAERPAIDGSPGPFFEGYWHWWCDDELIATARKRGVYAYAERARIRHHHPMVGGEDDETYRRGRERRQEDRRLFLERSAEWM